MSPGQNFEPLEGSLPPNSKAHHALVHDRVGLASLVEGMVARVDIDIVRGLSATDSHDLQYRIVERHGEGPVP